MKQDNQPNQTNKPKETSKQFCVVGIGASAGGLEAFNTFIEALPEDSGMAFILVQHLDPEHQSQLPEILQRNTKIPVKEIRDKMEVKPNHIYVIPSNKTLSFQNKEMVLKARDKRNDLSPYQPINSFLTSLAKIYGSYAIGVILSGTGSDGTKGLKAIKDHGGITFAQDKKSAAYPAMPENAAEADVVDFIMSPGKIPGKILDVAKTINKVEFNTHQGEELISDQDSEIKKKTTKDAKKPVKKEKESSSSKKESEIFQQILALLRIRKEIDFTYYKQTTIRRRILRRVALTNKQTLTEYLQYLRNTAKEQDLLYQDLLIPVTNFFRDQEIFKNLSSSVFPKILENKNTDKTIRVWIAGCSTGEEVYSIAISLLEYLKSQKEGTQNYKIQIFGTDINEIAISKARRGIYKANEVEGISNEILETYFTKTDGSYHVHKDLRELCVFSLHNFLKDPPFGKMDFMSCRNVLIYLQPYLQKKALINFHYALNPGGLLLLGKSETISSASEFFTVAERDDKLFSRKDKTSRYKPSPSNAPSEEDLESHSEPPSENKKTNFQKSADDLILRKYSPSGVVVNEAMDIVYFRGNTSKFLEQYSGKPTHNLLKMAKMGLSFELRNILHKVKKELTDEMSNNPSVIKKNIPVETNGQQFIVSLEAMLLPNLVEPYYLILFHDDGFELEASQTIKSTENSKDARIHQLEQELSHAREDMRSITEDQEATNEELQSANEELQSSKEELQSLNEELETSKEELQSTNEELITLNDELVNNNKRLTVSKNYSQDIVSTLREPLVVLDKSLNVKSANAAFYKKFHLDESEIEGKAIFDLENKGWNIPELKNLLREILPKHSSFYDHEITHDFPGLGQRTMLLNGREIIREEGGEKLILLVFGDITDKRLIEKNLEKSEIKFKLLVDSISQLIWISNAEGNIEFFNPQWQHYTGINSGESIKDGMWEEAIHPDDLKEFKDQFNKCIDTGKSFTKETRLELKEGNYNWYLAKAMPYYNPDGEIMKWFGSFTNIEVQKQAEATLRKSEEHFRQLAELIPDKITKANAEGEVTYYNQSWLNYTGLTRDELKETSLNGFLHPKEKWEIKKKWKKSVDSGDAFEMEIQILNKSGDYCWHLVRSIPVKDEKEQIKFWIGTTTEIQKLKEEEKRKEDFLKMVSHELKTPVTSIKGYTQLLLDMLMASTEINLDSIPLKPSLERIDSQVSRLTRLIAEILDLSRIEGDKMVLHKKAFNLNDLIDESIQDIKYSSRESNIDIDHEGSFEVCGDMDRIGQVLINFITNAIKYSPDDKNIEVRVFESGNNKVSVSVKDHGIGIDQKHLKNIFKRFYRVSQKNDETYSGFGIGLFLAKEIIERHRGNVAVKSNKGEGSEFIFTIPTITKSKSTKK
ncbi:chemotaxis protein CheB [Christiangramia forsetii]|uniref:histidine kinase n=2 Tax=Christiangramia forsetii TaxID=411153 RepID=A0M210_CHRFK|nr:chemotaxis protein CheB [Christiangramia forsetii]GGG44817.1 hypothetical protein GCM10011532_31030 [Christiangramia forsetii]CAL66655.1 two-component system sensor histidine kinase/methyl-esterase/transferase hybrid [Christiangramia forsetii KT0803]